MKFACVALSVLTFIALAARPAAAVTDEQVQATIQKMVESLYKQQNEWGTWDPEQPALPSGKPEDLNVYGWNYGGTTALVTYALLTAGESYQGPRLKRAIEFLKANEPTGTYAAGLRNHVWSHLPASFEAEMKQDTKWLLEAQGGGPAKGAYMYTSYAVLPPSSRGGGYDNSNTQYGVLGAWEAAKRNVPINTTYWQLVGKHFIETQNKDGGWAYVAGQGDKSPSSITMTASGLTCLYIVQDYLVSQDFRTPGSTRKHPLQEVINKGLTWFEGNYVAAGGGYYMMGVERVALASGRKYFQGKDWYAEGANYIVAVPGDGPVEEAFKLIFLVRGRIPIFANKLSIPDFDWNNRPRDLTRLTEWMSDEVEKETNWQVVEINTKPEEWLDAPILYLASHTALKLNPEQEAKIKRYIDLGGMVITTADEGDAAFNKSVTEMYSRLYPQYQFEKLDPKSELLTINFPLKGDKIGVTAMHNGVRYIALHIPRDISWTLHSANHTDEFLWEFLANTYYYATEKGQARPRLSQHFTPRAAQGGGPKVEVARVKYEGNWNPVPLAWEVQSNIMFNSKKADVGFKEVELKDLAASGVKFAHIAGAGEPKFNEAEAAALKAFVGGGGVVLFENAGGRDPRFSQAVTAMLTAAFPSDPIRPLSLQSQVVTGAGFGGYDVSKAEYRAYTLLRSGRFKGPRLQAVTLNGRPSILISNEDLSMAMLNQPIWGVYGYNTPSAQKIMTNLVLWSQQAKPAAPVAPAAAAAPAPQ